jgi:hypothetical protein
MPEPPEGELASAALDSAAPPQEDQAAADLRRPQQAPDQPHLDQAAAAPTYGGLQVPSEEPLLTNEIETDSGEATQPPTSSESLATSTVTTGGVAGTSLQHIYMLRAV